VLSEPSPKSNSKKSPSSDKPIGDAQIIIKECPICKVTFEDKTIQEASQRLADHIAKYHPEPVVQPKPVLDPEIPKEDKKKFTLECQVCGHLVEQDSKEKLDEIMQTHLLSHDEESKTAIQKKQTDSSNLMIYGIAFLALVISASIVFGGLWLKSKKSFDKTEGK